MLLNIFRSKLSLAFLFFLFPMVSLSANPFLDNLTWATHGSIFYFATKNEKQDADPSPILPSAGVSAAWQFWDYLRVELTEDIYFKNYEYNSTLEIAMPCNPENRSAFVMGFLTGFQLTGFYPITKSGIGVRAYAGPAIDMRLVFLAFGLHHPADFTGDIETDAQLQTNAIRKYFWSNGRWFYPVAGVGMDFPVNEKFLLGFDLRVWFPVSNNEWRFGAGLRITPRRNTSRSQTQVQPQLEIPAQIQTDIQPEAEAEIQLPAETEDQAAEEIQDDI